MKHAKWCDLTKISETDLRLLGKRVSTYYSNRESSLRSLVAVGVVSAATVFFAIRFGVSLHFLDLSLLMIAIATAIMSVRRLMSRRKLVVHLHQQGMIYTWPRNAKVILWPEISEVYDLNFDHSNTETKRAIRIHLIDGQRIRFQGLDGMTSLSRRINGIVANRLLDRIKSVYRSGNWIRFGRKLALSSHGLQIGMKVISWFEISELEYRETRAFQIRCTATNAWSVRVPKRAVANVQLLELLLDWIKENKSLANESELQTEDGRAIGVGDQFQSETDLNDLILDGYEWDEIDDVVRGDCTVEELLSRGPRRRPRNPK